MVVLPFGNIDGAPSNQAFSNGLQETVATMLARNANSANSVFVVPLSDMQGNEVRTIADAQAIFNADFELSGSVQWNDAGLQLTLNLNDSQAAHQQDPRGNAFRKAGDSVYESSATSAPDQPLASLLGEGFVLPSPQTVSGETTRDSEAYKLYVEGQGYLLAWRQSRRGCGRSRESFEIDLNGHAAAAKLAEAFVRKYALSRDTNWIERANSVLGHVAAGAQTPDVRLAQAMVWQAAG